MKHGSLISPDEASFGFGNSKAVFEATSSGHSAGLATGDAITVPDAQLLFNGEFKRSGDDLKIVGDDGKAFLVSDYFKNDKRPTLLSPEGAALTGDVVDALAGPLAPGQYAQAGTPQSANQAIGRVEKAEGNATVVRNGVTITLNNGDVIQKGDVAQTGSGGSLAIVFSDGSAFSLGGNARMVLNDFVYSDGGSNNSALISLVQGSISFIAGQVAKTGDMRVDTPVATMGIRGTAVLVEISADNGATKFSVMLESNGTVGSFNLYDKASGALLGVVNSSSIGWVVTPAGPLQVIAQQVQKTPAELARELAIIQQFNFNLSPFDPNAPQDPQPDPNRRGDVNPQNTNPNGSPYIPGGSVITGNITPPIGANGQTGPNYTQGNPTNPDGSTTDTPGADDGPPQTGPGTNTQTVLVNNIYGSAGNDDNDNNPWIEGTDGNDFVYAGAGDDIIIAGHGGGNDFYDGDGDNGQGFAGEGIDTIRFASTTQGVTVNLTTGTASGAEIGNDILVNIENVTGGTGDDSITGDSGANILIGRGGDDTINGGGGDDELHGDYAPIVYSLVANESGEGGGDDILTGGAGDDIVDGGAGDDIAVYSGKRSDYFISGKGTIDDPFVITDLRDDSPDGTDTVYDIETLRFSDGDVDTSAPVANADTDDVREAGAGSLGDPFATGNVLANDSDVAGDDLKVVGVAKGEAPGDVSGGVNTIVQGTYGFLILLSSGGYLYTLNNLDPDTQALSQGEQAEETFTYTIADETGLTDTSTLTIQITGTNDAPVVAHAIANTEAALGVPFSFEFAGNTFSDVDSPSLTYIATLSNGNPLPAWLTFDPQTRTFSGTPASADVLDIKVTASDGQVSVSDTFSLTVAAPNNKPLISAPDSIDYWTNSGSGNVTAINQISFGDIDAGNDTVTVTLSLDPSQGTLEADNIFGDGVSVSGSGTRTVTLTGSIADINAYLADNNVSFDPPGSSLADRTLHVTINDGGNNGSGGAQTATADITLNSVSYTFSNGNDSVDLHNVNLDGISSVNMMSGHNVLVTSWNHLDVSATTYHGGDTGGDDTVTLVFSPDQFVEILSDASSRSELQSYLDGNPGSGNSADTLNLANTDWNAVVKGFEIAHVALAAGEDYVTYGAIGDDLPNYMSGQTGNGGNNTLVASAGGQTLNGNGGNDILVARSSGSTLNGGEGADLLLGSDGHDVLAGGIGNDILAGNGGSDTFIFRPGMGHDTVIGFTAGVDKIDLDQFGENNFSLWFNTPGAFVQNGDDTVIHLSETDDITLKNVVAASLTANDFILH